MRKNPYFSLDGLSFQTPGSGIEQSINLQSAMARICAFATKGEAPQDAMEALAWLEDKYTKLQPCCDHMRIAFLLDDFDDCEQKRRIAIRAYNCLVDRLNNMALRKS